MLCTSTTKTARLQKALQQYLRIHRSFRWVAICADFNNDSYPDIVTVDMLPNDNKRQKLMNIAMNNDRFNYALSLGYMPQYARNMLQLNNGPDANGVYSFSEIGQLAGIYKTDWSWSPLFADFDNDGWKDLYITNGIPKILPTMISSATAPRKLSCNRNAISSHAEK
jgi:hypothetical protein